MPGKIRVLIVDDSLITTQAIARVLQADPEIEVVGRALDGRKALDEVPKLRPDVVTMDITMPNMNGIEATEAIVKRYRTPVVIVSAYASTHGVAIQTLQALMRGAVESVQKPSGEIGLDLDLVAAELVAKVKAAARARPPAEAPEASTHRAAPSGPILLQAEAPSIASWTTVRAAPVKIVGIGVSTGGPSSLEKFVPGIPEDYPAPIVLVIHMPELFIPILAEMLDGSSKLAVSVVRDGEALLPGHLYVGPANLHFEVGIDLRARLRPGPPVNGCVPSVDVLFDSLARHLRGQAVGLVLTGMGRDGAQGLAAMRAQGCVTAAQDERSSVVYGMPRAAAASGAAAYEVPLQHVTRFLTRIVGR